MTRVLALDPGERVGYAVVDVDDSGQWTDLEHGILPLRDMALTVHSNLLHWPHIRGAGIEPWEPDFDVVVCETWKLHPDKARSFVGSSFPSVQFIGMVRLCCWVSGTKLVMQGPSVKKGALQTMKRLRPELHEICTRPVAHDDGHDQDAITHAWYWTLKNTEVLK